VWAAYFNPAILREVYGEGSNPAYYCEGCMIDTMSEINMALPNVWLIDKLVRLSRDFPYATGDHDGVPATGEYLPQIEDETAEFAFAREIVDIFGDMNANCEGCSGQLPWEEFPCNEPCMSLKTDKQKRFFATVTPRLRGYWYDKELAKSKREFEGK